MRSRHGPSIGSGSTIVEHVAACCTSTSGSGPPHPGNLECSYRPSSRVLEGGGLAGAGGRLFWPAGGLSLHYS